MRRAKEKAPEAWTLSQLLDINEAITLFFKSNASASDCIERAKASQLTTCELALADPKDQARRNERGRYE